VIFGANILLTKDNLKTAVQVKKYGLTIKMYKAGAENRESETQSPDSDSPIK